MCTATRAPAGTGSHPSLLYLFAPAPTPPPNSQLARPAPTPPRTAVPAAQGIPELKKLFTDPKVEVTLLAPDSE